MLIVSVLLRKGYMEKGTWKSRVCTVSSHSESEALFHEVETLSHTELILSSLSFKD